MFEITFNIAPSWYAQQMKLAAAARPAGGARIFKERERLLIGFVDRVLILAFPNFEASSVTAGRGEGWFSLNPHRFGKLLATFSHPVSVTLRPATITIDGFTQSYPALKVRLGKNDPELAALCRRIDEVTAEQCHQRLVAEREKQLRIAEHVRWHRAEGATNTTPLVEHIRDGSLIVYKRTDAKADDEPARAVVDKKVIIGNSVSLLCHDFHGKKITVDPRWVTHVGC